MLERLDITDDRQPRRQPPGVILESAAEGILGLDREGRVTFANSAAADLLGAARGRSARAATSTTSCTADEPGARAHTMPTSARCSCRCRRGIVQHMEDDVFWRSDGIELPRPRTRRRRSSSAASWRARCSRSTTSPSASASRRSSSTWPTTTRVTGLFNRRRFEQELARHLSYDARYGSGRRRARARPRQLQVRQRHARPQGGRRGDHARRAHDPRAAPRDRHARAPRRRRVRDPAAGGGRSSRRSPSRARSSTPSGHTR